MPIDQELAQPGTLVEERRGHESERRWSLLEDGADSVHGRPVLKVVLDAPVIVHELDGDDAVFEDLGLGAEAQEIVTEPDGLRDPDSPQRA
jgi:hypothetical protein